jgi:hypothetical protein
LAIPLESFSEHYLSLVSSGCALSLISLLDLHLALSLSPSWTRSWHFTWMGTWPVPVPLFFITWILGRGVTMGSWPVPVPQLFTGDTGRSFHLVMLDAWALALSPFQSSSWSFYLDGAGCTKVGFKANLTDGERSIFNLRRLHLLQNNWKEHELFGC